MAQIAAVLALGAGPLGPGLERVESDLDAAICAWQLRGMGVAFHLFLLDHQGHFPLGTVRAGSPTQDELDWIGLLKPYLGFEREIKIIGSWSGKPDRLDLLPAQFLCPARQHHWTTVATRGSEYGYIDSVGSPARNSKTLDGSLANCTALTYADINPPRQILVVESTSGGRYYSPAQLAVPHEELGNVLFADGHVEAHELDWAKKMNPYAAPSPDNPWRTLPPPGGDKP
jgi:prepilin-type processing-associated H-X9-DG protein